MLLAAAIHVSVRQAITSCCRVCCSGPSWFCSSCLSCPQMINSFLLERKSDHAMLYSRHLAHLHFHSIKATATLPLTSVSLTYYCLVTFRLASLLFVGHTAHAPQLDLLHLLFSRTHGLSLHF